MNEELYQIAIAKPLAEKVDIAVATIQHYAPQAATWDMFEPWIHVCDSFGKDSGVQKYLFERAGVEFKSYHNLTTLDAPELIQFGREHHPDAIIIKPKKGIIKYENKAKV